MKNALLYLLLLLVTIFTVSCSATRYVPEGAYLLDEVKIHTDNKDIKSSSLTPYVRQTPNLKWFSTFKTQLYIYNLSGRDSTRWFNKFLRRIGDAPVIYNEELAQRSEDEIQKVVRNMGYMGATVEKQTQAKKKKIKLSYQVTSGKPYKIRSIKQEINDPKIFIYLKEDSVNSLLKEGMFFDVNVLDAERQRITNHLLRNGYYKFNKDFITYTADTVKNTYLVDITLHLLLYRTNAESLPKNHPQYTINKVSFITDYDAMQSSLLNSIKVDDSIHYAGYRIYYKDKLFLRPKVLVNNLRITPGRLYDEREVQRTYNNFGVLPALKYTNIRFSETQVGDSAQLNAYILLTKSKQQSVALEVEGTNSAGDLGAAASVSYSHRNFFRGSERFTLKFRGAYEAISGLTQDYYKNDNYTEYGIEASINFPNFLFPFLSSEFKRNIKASTEFSLQYNYQMRPEFSRMVASGSWGYKWSHRRTHHRIDLIDINYLYMPWKSVKFDSIYEGKGNYILEYNYKNRFIARMGYTYNYNSIGSNLITNTNSYSVKFAFESAGNLLYGISKLIGLSKNSDNEYSIFKIPFAQYLKGDFDFAKNILIDNRNSLAFHIGMGIAVPYGNAKVIPFEKRYFSGGANSVRGWSVRSLGPGSFVGDRENFLNHSGDIKLDASIEYRSRLFWKFQGAMFVDAGNIWTLREYEEQSGGKFKIDKFYKEIAVAYGLGLRLDLDFFVIRIDGGMKAINPVYSSGKLRYPVIRPKFGRDFALHFAVGYPF